ncbi:MAG: putative molybdenum carrier protein [Phycisphaerales bacterium]
MLEQIISGGQTGVDQAALDVALELGIPCGGWCPRDRWSEAGPIDEHYPLTESPSADPTERTERNVRDADGTLIIARGGVENLTGGTALTRKLATEQGQPMLAVDPTDPGAAEAVTRWILQHEIRSLNVAGPRASTQPGIGDLAAALLREVLPHTIQAS